MLHDDTRYQAGFASIIVVMTLVIILGLILVGFGKLMRDDQRNALDRELSTQAYYAAESGINDAVNALQNGYKTPATGAGSSGNTCVDSTNLNGKSYQHVLNSNGNGNGNVEYSCLMINTHPTSLEYSPLISDDSKYISLSGQNTTSGNATAISSILISWQGGNDTSAVYNPNPEGTFPAYTSWKDGAGNAITPGVLRISLTPLSAVDRTSLIQNTLTAYLNPSASTTSADATGTSTLDYSTTNGTGIPGGSNTYEQQGQIIDGGCKSTGTPKQCNVRITNLTASTSGYLLLLKSLYTASDVEVQAYDSSGNALRIEGAQAVVDSTGKAQDELRRVQVRVPEQSQYFFPEGVLDAAGSICKLLQVAPPNTTDGTCPQ